MNVKKGFLRLVIVLSIVPVVVGFPFSFSYKTGEFGFGLMVCGPIIVWLAYFAAIFVRKGFSDKYCANCEKTIGKLEESQIFKEHVVCAECHNKLSENQKEEIS